MLYCKKKFCRTGKTESEENTMTRAEQLAEMTARHRDLIYETADAIWKHPETGYRE